ncbi:MAG: SapC family protein [Nitrosomonadales bacterium]
MLNFIGKLVELNSTIHKNLRIDDAQLDYGCTRDCTALPITFDEFTRAAQEYPIAFMRDDDTQWYPVILLGLPGTGNLLLNAEGGWQAAYIPQALQHYPFVASLHQPTAVHLDETCPALNLATGELLVDADGVLQPRANAERQFLQGYAELLAQTRLMSAQLDQLDVLSPLTCDGAERDFPGMYTIDESKFKQLSDTALPSLFHSGALQLAYLQLASQDRLTALIHTANRQRASNADKARAESRKTEQSLKKPVLKARIQDAAPLTTSPEDQKEIQRKQEVVKKLADEAYQLAQAHKQRYTQSTAEIPLPQESPAPVDTGIHTHTRPQWRWIVPVVAGAAIFSAYFWTGEKNETSPSTHIDATPVVTAPALSDPMSAAMLRLEPGKFEMGSTDGDADEEPVQQVNISMAFELGKTEVTQAQWLSVMGSLPEKLSFKKCGDACPVENVSWNDAQGFILKLNTQSGKSYRLPSEAEWEYACRAGKNQRYCGGNNPDDLAWYNNKTPHPVALKQANAWGLYDMSGNVWEWVDDCYHAHAVQGDHKQTCEARVLRGGSWSNDADTPRAANRYKRAASERVNNNGFRLARTLP